MANLAAVLEGLAVVMQVAVGDGDHLSHRGTAPMKLSIALSPTLAVEPSGRPATARRWFSNWLHSAPSMVQCPELCTRGAISLAFRPPSTSKNSKASTPT